MYKYIEIRKIQTIKSARKSLWWDTISLRTIVIGTMNQDSQFDFVLKTN
jgi:hypothetical protein